MGKAPVLTGAFFVSVSIISGWVKLFCNAIVQDWRGDLQFWGLIGFSVVRALREYYSCDEPA
jgi:hypothetical protein